MSNLRQAAQQALEAWFRPHGINYVDFKPYMEALRAALAEPERKPLTDEEIVRLMVGEDRARLMLAGKKDPYFSEFAQGAIRELVESGRAIERAHGIGEQT